VAVALSEGLKCEWTFLKGRLNGFINARRENNQPVI
jgi:hypothetical protein